MHARGFLHQDHVQVFGEVVLGVPFLEHLERVAEILHSGEVGRDDLHLGLLLAGVRDELAAEHRQVGRDLAALRVERVAGGVKGNEAFSLFDRGQQARETPLGHRRLIAMGVFERLGENAGGVEGEDVELVEIAVEHAAVLAANDVNVVLVAPALDDFFRVAQLIAVAVYDRVLEAGTAGKVEDFGLLAFHGPDPAQRKSRHSDQGRPGADQHLTTLHG